MDHRSSAVVQEAEHAIPSKTRKFYHALINFLPWRRKHIQPLTKEGVRPTESAPIAERESTPPPDEESLDLSLEEPVQTTDIDTKAQNQEDEALAADTSLPPLPAQDRDLWAEAWKLLDEKAKKRLREPWRSFSNNSQGFFEVSQGDKSAKRKDRTTQGGLKGENKAKESAYDRCVLDVVNGLHFRQVEDQDQWDEASKGKAEAIVNNVLTVKKIVDAAIGFDPSGYGASAWAVVSFGLTLAQNRNELRDEAFQATAFLSELLSRYSKKEVHYRRVKFKRSDIKELEDAIVQVYVAIFAYSDEVKNAADGPTHTKIKQSFLALTENPLTKLKEIITVKNEIVNAWQAQVDQKYETQFQEHMEKSLGGIEARTAEILVNLKNVQDNAAAARKYVEILVDQSVLNWLSNPPSTSENRHESLRGAIKWKGDKDQEKHRFLQETHYLHWKKYPQSVLWIHAPAGSGKSSLCCSIINDIVDDYDCKAQQKHLVYWYFQSGTADSKDITLVIRSILRQLCSAKSPQHKFPQDIQDWLLHNHNRNPPPSRKEFLEKVIEVIKALRLDIFIVLDDGLDEFRQQTNEITRDEIMTLVTQIFKAANANLHILLVSKFENNIQGRLQQEELKDVVVEMDVKSILKAELDDFIDLTMKNEDFFESLSSDVKDKIRERLKSGEESFVWAVSLLEDLRKCKGKGKGAKIKSRLLKVPNSMALKYDKILNDIDEAKRPPTRIILMWMLRNNRPGEVLTQDEVAAAARMTSASDVNDLRIKAMMITEDVASRSIKFESPAKDHLQERLPKPGDGVDNSTLAPSTTPPWYSFSDAEAHLEIATRCLEVLLDKDEKSKRKKSALKDYAARYWHEHYLAVCDLLSKPNAKELQELDRQVRKLFTPGSAAFESWLRSCDPDKDFKPSEEFDLTSQDDVGSAKRVGSSENSVSSLNDSGNDSGNDSDTESSSDEGSGSGSESDSYEGGESTSDEDSKSDEENKPRADPVYYAVKLGLLDVAIKMIEKKAPYAQPGCEGTVIQLALYHQHWDVVNAIFRYDHNLEAAMAVRDGPHGTPLYIASARVEGHMASTILETLIEKGARADGVKDGKYGSALHVAAYSGYSAAVRLLLEKGGARVDQKGGMFGTALHAAAAKGHTDVVQELLSDHKADPMIVSGLLGTALQAALVASSSEDTYGTVELLQTAIDAKLSICRGIERVKRSRIGWEPAVDRLHDLNSWFLDFYKQLFTVSPSKAKEFQMPYGDDLNFEQKILAGLLERCYLPAADGLSGYRDQLGEEYPHYTIVQDQLDDIQRALPRFRNCSREQELNGLDFRFKALFWSGVNYVLENLEPLIEDAVEAMQSAALRADSLRDHAYLALRRRPGRLRSLDSRFLYRYAASEGFGDGNMIFSDKLALEVSRQQRLLSQKPLFRNGQTSDGMTTLMRRLTAAEFEAPTSDDGDEVQSASDGNIELHLVLDSLLPLVRDIIEFGRECDRLHETATQHESDNISDVVVRTNTDLTFELLAAVARLSTSIDQWRRHRNHLYSRSTDMETSLLSLAETVRLLGTVRLPRINKLAKVMKQEVQDLKEELSPKSDQSEDQIFERMRKLVRDTVRVEMEHQQDRGWGTYWWGGKRSTVKGEGQISEDEERLSVK